VFLENLELINLGTSPFAAVVLLRPENRRIRFRFRILTLIFLLLSISIACGVYVQSESQRKLEDKLSEYNCRVHLKYRLPSFLTHLVGVRFVSTISDVQVWHYSVFPDDGAEIVDILRQLPDLETVWVYDPTPEKSFASMIKNKLSDVKVVDCSNRPGPSFDVEYSDDYSLRHFFLIAGMVLSITFVCKWLVDLSRFSNRRQ